MIEPIYCLGAHGLWSYLIRRTAGGFVVGLVSAFLVRPLVSAIRRSFVR